MIDKPRLEAKCSTWNITLTGTQLDQLDAFAEILVDYNQKVNLTAITDPEGIEERERRDVGEPGKLVSHPREHLDKDEERAHGNARPPRGRDVREGTGPRPAHAGEEQPQTERGHVDGDEVGGNELAREHGMGRSQLERSERHREKNEAENENARLREHETRAPHGLCEQVGDAAALDVTDHEPAGEHRHENEGEHHEQKAVQVVDDEL